MSIIINLLPDLRQAKLRERRRRQLVSGISVLVWAVCIGVVALLSVILAGQEVAKNVLTSNIKDKESKLQNISGLTDALTAQQHLDSLKGLYGKRVYMTKFFDAYQQADPANDVLNSLQLDESNLLTISGVAKSYADVAKLDRALEASNVRVGLDAKSGNEPYFTDVTITNVSEDNQGVSYTMTATVASSAMEKSNGQ